MKSLSNIQFSSFLFTSLVIYIPIPSIYLSIYSIYTSIHPSTSINSSFNQSIRHTSVILLIHLPTTKCHCTYTTTTHPLSCWGVWRSQCETWPLPSPPHITHTLSPPLWVIWPCTEVTVGGGSICGSLLGLCRATRGQACHWSAWESYVRLLYTDDRKIIRVSSDIYSLSWYH